MSERRSAIMMISGGVDSVTTAYYVAKELKTMNMLVVFGDFKQRTYQYEEFCIEKISERLAVPLKKIDQKW